MLNSLTISFEIVYRELVVLELTDELSSVHKEGAEIVKSCLNAICNGTAAFKSALRIKKTTKSTLCPHRSSWSM